jgi:hypothetical protein
MMLKGVKISISIVLLESSSLLLYSFSDFRAGTDPKVPSKTCFPSIDEYSVKIA